jgi:signal peptide peptidase SppA
MGEEPVGSTFTATVNGQEWSFAGGVLVDVKPSGMPLLAGGTAAAVKPAGALGPWASVDQYRRELAARAGNKPVLLHADVGWPTTSQQRKPYAVKNRVAIIEISGVLSNDPWYWDETGYGQIQYEVLFASTDADVDGILLKIDSPGGYTDGAYETADLIHKVGKQKPVWAAAAPMAYSAAYLLASQAAKIYTPEISGGVGSIGVYCMHVDYSEALKGAGIKATFIQAGEGKTDANPYEPLSERARKDLQADVDRLYAAFVSRVSRGRGLKESAIIALGAYTYDGAQAAIAADLADKPGTPEVAIATMSKTKDGLLMSEPLAEAGGVRSPTMDEATNTGTAAPQAQPPAQKPPAPAVAVPAATNGDLEKYMSDQEQIRDLCAIAGCPAKALDYQQQKLTPEQVRAELKKARVTGQAQEINATIGGLTGIGNKRQSLAERMTQQLRRNGKVPTERGA